MLFLHFQPPLLRNCVASLILLRSERVKWKQKLITFEHFSHWNNIVTISPTDYLALINFWTEWAKELWRDCSEFMYKTWQPRPVPPPAFQQQEDISYCCIFEKRTTNLQLKTTLHLSSRPSALRLAVMGLFLKCLCPPKVLLFKIIRTVALRWTICHFYMFPWSSVL